MRDCVIVPWADIERLKGAVPARWNFHRLHGTHLTNGPLRLGLLSGRGGSIPYQSNALLPG